MAAKIGMLGQMKILLDEALPKKGGAISLIDLFLLFNKNRLTCLVPPEEVLKSINLFPSMNIPYSVNDYANGLKIIEASFIFISKLRQFFFRARIQRKD